MLGRQILAADICEPAADTIGVSALSDFITGPYRSVKKPRGQLAFPCIIDVARGRTLYVPGLDAHKLREASFANRYAKLEAKSVLSVPWEVGPINRPAIMTEPIYVFSSGRCGSTLLHKILIAAGIHGVSEPDIATALISPVYFKRRLARPLLRWVTRNYVRDLVSALGEDNGPFVIKLRSQFCRAAEPLLKDTRERRTIFMTRDFESWSRSVAQLFRLSPGTLVLEYRRSLRCYAYLCQTSNCHFLRYEDLIAQPRQEMARLSEFLGRDIPAAAVDAAMAVGSQQGTRLERPSEQGLARWDAMKDEVHRYWMASGTAEFCDRILRSYAPHAAPRSAS